MIKRPVLPYFKGCQTRRGERGLVLVELVREGTERLYQKLIQGKRCVRVFLLKCGTALINIELDIHFLDNHSGFEFRLF